jgi:hypothetical protein
MVPIRTPPSPKDSVYYFFSLAYSSCPCKYRHLVLLWARRNFGISRKIYSVFYEKSAVKLPLKQWRSNWIFHITNRLNFFWHHCHAQWRPLTLMATFLRNFGPQHETLVVETEHWPCAHDQCYQNSIQVKIRNSSLSYRHVSNQCLRSVSFAICICVSVFDSKSQQTPIFGKNPAVFWHYVQHLFYGWQAWFSSHVTGKWRRPSG